jgi:phenylpropionate dioxygenase-like ring-hydroxylating dioxygenase large terminal subunit
MDKVMWRSREQLVACARYCTHAGADLSGGRIVDGRLVCPYHGYSFGPDGHPDAAIPALRRLATDEILGDGIAWLGEEEPTWRCPSGTNLVPSGWKILEDRTLELQASVLEIVENVADVEHFVPVHQSPQAPVVDSVDISGHLLRIMSTHRLRSGSRFGVKVHAHGPGLMVSDFGRGPWLRAIALHAPASARAVQARFIVAVPEGLLSRPRYGIATVALELAGQLSAQLLEDNQIWRSRNTGIDTRSSQPIQTVRRWFTQFESVDEP